MNYQINLNQLTPKTKKHLVRKFCIETLNNKICPICGDPLRFTDIANHHIEDKCYNICKAWKKDLGKAIIEIIKTGMVHNGCHNSISTDEFKYRLSEVNQKIKDAWKVQIFQFLDYMINLSLQDNLNSSTKLKLMDIPRDMIRTLQQDNSGYQYLNQLLGMDSIEYIKQHTKFDINISYTVQNTQTTIEQMEILHIQYHTWIHDVVYSNVNKKWTCRNIANEIVSKGLLPFSKYKNGMKVPTSEVGWMIRHYLLNDPSYCITKNERSHWEIKANVVTV